MDGLCLRLGQRHHGELHPLFSVLGSHTTQGIIFRTSLRRTRALVPDANSPVGTSTSAAKKLFNRFSRAPASKAYASEAYHPDMEQSTAASSTSSSKRDRKVFNISAPSESH